MSGLRWFAIKRAGRWFYGFENIETGRKWACVVGATWDNAGTWAEAYRSAYEGAFVCDAPAGDDLHFSRSS